MCLKGRSRFCLICVLLYTFLPSPVAKSTEEPPQFAKASPKVPVHSDFDFHSLSDHDDHNHHEDMQVTDEPVYKVKKDFYINALMVKYGNGENMSYEGFEHMLHHLGLGGSFVFDHSIDCHKGEDSSTFKNLHIDHDHDDSSEASVCNETMDKHDEKGVHIHGANPERDNSYEQDDHDHAVDHDHADNNDHTDNHAVELEHAGDHDHSNIHAEDHDHAHDHAKDDHTHDHADDHTADHNHADDHKEDHDHAHDHAEDDHTHDHADDQTADHKHADDHKEDHDHAHGHAEDDHTHDHADDQTADHKHADDQTADHKHADDHKEDHDHAHDHAEDDHTHDHADDHPADHKHADDHKEDHADDHEHTDGHVHNDEHDHSHEDESKSSATQMGKQKRHVSSSDQCLPASVMIRLVGVNAPDTLTKSMFKELCPSLIYQIDADTCHTNHERGNHQHDQAHHTQSAKAVASFDIGSIPAKVWGFSTVAVLIISLVGLLGVAVIPIMQKVFYNHMLQFLVALAVGALSGDALLHLLPHAMSGGHDHGDGGDEAGHDHGTKVEAHDLTPVMKGLCGLMGIYFFFVTERLLTIFTDKKRRKKSLKNQNKFMNGEELVKIGEKLAGKENECDEMIMTIHPNKGRPDNYPRQTAWGQLAGCLALQAYADETHKELCVENSTALLHEHRMHVPTQNGFSEENDSMLRLESSKGHGHGHSHGVDGVPNSVASVAWMVILGDGIHNFSDGLAIGAAFANSIAGGFSTSVAVFCHELPHEIGDFAMLLRAGMAPKQALLYNCLSSVLCFVGMLIGVALGNVQDASLWIFAIVGGMFLYIALVDMLPEMTSVETKEGENSYFHLLIQCIGMLLGAGIMFIIAIYEDRLRTLLD